MHIIDELHKRSQLAQVVDSIIRTHVRLRSNCHVRLKRGVMHELVAQYLGLRVSNQVRAFVNSRMVANGYPLAIMRGNLYYKHAELKKHGI